MGDSMDNSNVLPCPDCGQTVSKMAEACPHCGRPMKRQSKAREGRPFVTGGELLFLMILGIGIWYAIVNPSFFKSVFDRLSTSQTPTPLPADYRTLAENLAFDMKSSPDQFRDNKDMIKIIAEGRESIMALRGIQSSDRDIAYISEQGQSAFAEAVHRMGRISALPKPPGAGDLFVSSFVDGFFDNVFGGYARGKDAEDKQNAIMVEAQALIGAIEQLDAAHQLLPKVAEKYSAPQSVNNGRIIVDFD